MAQRKVETIHEVPDICLQECWRGRAVSTGRCCTLELTAKIPKGGWEAVQGQVPRWPHSMGNHCLGYQGKKMFTKRGMQWHSTGKHPKGVLREAGQVESPCQ